MADREGNNDDAGASTPPPDVVVGALAEAGLCPLCHRGGAESRLTFSTDFDGHGCPRCGGCFLPASGSELLLQTLGLDRPALLDLADVYGGARLPCPGCSSRMRALVLRGVDVSVCFACAGVALPHRGLETLTGGQARGAPAPPRVATALTTTTSSPTSSSPTLARAAHHVRLDLRHPLQKAISFQALVIAAFLLSMAAWLPVPMGPGIVCAAIGLLLRRRRTLDVFPRAGRLLYGRRYLPALADDTDARPLDPACVLVLRRSAPGFWRLHYEDSCARPLAVLGYGPRFHMVQRAHRLSQQLGARVRLPPKTPTRRTPSERPLGALAPRQPALVRRHPDNALLVLPMRQSGHDVVVVKNTVPAAFDDDGFARLRLHFAAFSKDQLLLRLHDDGHGAVVVIDHESAPLGSFTDVRAMSPVWHYRGVDGGVWLRLVRVPGPAGIGPVMVLDERGHVVGSIRHLDAALHVEPRPALWERGHEPDRERAFWTAAALVAATAL